MDTAAQKKHKLAVGTVVEVKIQPDQSVDALKVRGLVVWKRVAREEGLKAGVGVKFLHMTERDQYVFEDYVRIHGITSFIPRGAADEAAVAAG